MEKRGFAESEMQHAPCRINFGFRLFEENRLLRFHCTYKKKPPAPRCLIQCYP